MYILLAFLAACALGIGVHAAIPHRSLRGSAVAPAIAASAAAVVYTGLQWAGLAESDPLLWLASIGGGILVSTVSTVALTAARRRSDAVARSALGI